MDKGGWMLWLDQDGLRSLPEFIRLALSQCDEDSRDLKEAWLIKYLKKNVPHTDGDWFEPLLIGSVDFETGRVDLPGSNVAMAKPADILAAVEGMAMMITTDHPLMAALPGNIRKAPAPKTKLITAPTEKWLLFKESWESKKHPHKLTLAKQIVADFHPDESDSKEIERLARNIVNRYNKETK